MIFKLLIICLQNANTITNAHQERYATMMEIAWKVTFKINIQFDPPCIQICLTWYSNVLLWYNLIFLGCLNSDRLTGYEFSHEGYWQRDIFKGKTNGAKKCADECDKDNQCIAFVYRSDDTKCYVYHSLGVNTMGTGIRAYLKCSGMYEHY